MPPDNGNRHALCTHFVLVRMKPFFNGFPPKLEKIWAPVYGLFVWAKFWLFVDVEVIGPEVFFDNVQKMRNQFWKFKTYQLGIVLISKMFLLWFLGVSSHSKYFDTRIWKGKYRICVYDESMWAKIWVLVGVFLKTPILKTFWYNGWNSAKSLFYLEIQKFKNSKKKSVGKRVDYIFKKC